MAIQLFSTYGKRDSKGHLLGKATQPALINSIVSAVQEVKPQMPTKKLHTRLNR